jgi:hypothetical protein
MKRLAILGAVALLGALPSVASARSHFFFGFRVGVPLFVDRGYCGYGPYYYGPRYTYIAAPPAVVYSAPAPVVYGPPAVVYSAPPAPVVVPAPAPSTTYYYYGSSPATTYYGETYYYGH